MEQERDVTPSGVEGSEELEDAAKTVTESDGAQAEVKVEEGPSLEEQLAEAEAKAAENLDGWQRARAELANARKRFNQQMEEANVAARADVVSRLLPALDDFDRALANMPEEMAGDEWAEGIMMVRRNLGRILDRLQVEPIEAVGQPFDPHFHEALASEPSDEYESGTVTREMLTGYKIGDRVIRPSLVYVAE